MRTVYLTPPVLNPESIKEKISCIRAHRERIFAIHTEQQKDQLIYHNYGHGGAGWTFLFGSVNESIRQFQKALQTTPYYHNKPVCIIGAGCYGLLTALSLHYKGYQVRIVADKLEDIQSDKAAGFFFPRHRKCSNEAEKAIFQSIGLESYQEYLRIIKGEHPFIAQGPVILPAYFSPDIDPGFDPYIRLDLIDKPHPVLIDFGNGIKHQAQEYHIVFMSPDLLMQQLRQAIKTAAIPILQKKIASFDELPEQVIFNCAGQQAKLLTQDPRLVPVQGHLITLKNQPDVSKLQYLLNVKVTQQGPKGPRDELIYFAPKESGILGITFIRGQDDPTANIHEFDRLLERCKVFFTG